MKQTEIKSFIGPRNVRPLEITAQDCAEFASLQKLGINVGLDEMADVYGMDSLQAGVTTGAIPSVTQFLQSWLPGTVRALTQVRNIDALAGIAVMGNWEDEEVVQKMIESTGKAQPHGDRNNVPLANWNTAYERRTIVRFEQGFNIGKLESARAAKIGVDNGTEKRIAANLSLEIQRNSVGFYGFNSGANRTYGLLNDPSLGAYVTVAATGAGSSTMWKNKTFLNITADLRTMAAKLRVQSAGNIDPLKDKITLALATDCVDTLSVTNDLGTKSVRQWIAETYPNWRIESAPELTGANGGANVAYLYAETVQDSGTDGGATLMQLVPTKSMLLGVKQDGKGGVTEDYSNATAGLLVKRPFSIVRYTGM